MKHERYPGVRGQVFEVIVRQVLAGAPWQEICAGPMQANDISPEDIEAEVLRRRLSNPNTVNNKPNVMLLPIIIVAVLIAIAYAFSGLHH